MDKLQAIRFFLKLGETLSFKGTADYFGVPPSTVSRSIKRLEEELGTTLIERTTRQVRLTETGDWYRKEVSGPLRALAAADELAEAHARDPVGTVRLTALPGYGEIRLFPALEKFRKAHPQVICDVELTDRFLDLSTGEIDIALRATAEPPDYLVAKRLHPHEFTLVAAPSYLASSGPLKLVADIENHSALGYRGPNGIYPWIAKRPDGATLTVERKLSLISNHGLFLFEAALAGEGLAFLPKWGVSEALSEGRLTEVHLEDASLVKTSGAAQHIYMLFHPSKARLGKVRVMVEFLSQALSDT